MIYRYRTINNLIGEFNELENQEIYFAEYNDLNDPMEGQVSLKWNGDEIAWNGLFSQYLLSLEISFSQYLMGCEMEMITDIKIYANENSLPTEMYKSHFRKIKDDFFSNGFIKKLISILYETDVHLCESELITILHIIHHLALNSIINVFHDERMMDDGYFEFAKKFTIGESLGSKELCAIEQILSNDSEERNIIFDIAFSAFNQFRLMLPHEKDLKINKKKLMWFYLTAEFPKSYALKIQKLIHPEFFVTCFSKDCLNSLMWSYYADSHKGVCLIYEVPLINEEERILLKFKNEPEKYLSFQTIQYNNDYIEFNFFEMLGRLTGEQLNAWLADDRNNKSICYKKIYDDKERWRKNYWEAFNCRLLSKSTASEYEQELRLYVDNTFQNYDEPTSRVSKYKFEDLKGIIFGVKTSKKDISKILEIIARKCKLEHRTDFKIYQAKNSRTEKKLELDNLITLENIVNFKKE